MFKWLKNRPWWFWVLLVVTPCILAAPFSYFIVEKAIIAKMSDDLSSRYGDDYAILCLHMGGDLVDEPSLARFLKLLYEYNYTDGYEPEGSGHFTGKYNYLTMLISDNKTIRDCHWSFKEFKLVFEPTPYKWDIMSNLPDVTVEHYSYNDSMIIVRDGLRYCAPKLNGPGLSFYYREVKPPVMPAKEAVPHPWKKKSKLLGAPVHTARFIAQIKQALKDDNPAAFVKLVHFPISVTSTKTYIFEHPDDLFKEFPVIMPEAIRKTILDQPLADIFTSWKGVHLGAGNIWISDYRSDAEDLKITELYAGTGGDTSMILDAEFYRKDGRETIQPLAPEPMMKCIAEAGLPFQQYTTTEMNPYVTTVDPELGGGYIIYKADINNDGSEDIIVANIQSGSGGYSWNKFIYSNSSGQWKGLDYLELYRTTFMKDQDAPIEWNDFQEHMARPFLYKKNGKVYHGFDAWHYYLWEKDRLVQQDLNTKGAENSK